MKRYRSILGVTLLEIMLVLAVAALIITLSVRYYQSATASQQANTLMTMIQGITASADNLAVTSGSYATAGVNTTSIQTLMPNQSLQTPWNTGITIAGGTATTYTVTIPSVPFNVCPLIITKLNGSTDKHYTSSSTCSPTAATSITYTYNSAP